MSEENCFRQQSICLPGSLYKGVMCSLASDKLIRPDSISRTIQRFSDLLIIFCSIFLRFYPLKSVKLFQEETQYLILAGNSSIEALKRFGAEVGKSVTKKAIEKNITKEVMKKIWKVVPQKIITKAGQKSMTSFMKMVPLIGAPIGFGFDYLATRTVGKMAIKYYSS